MQVNGPKAAIGKVSLLWKPLIVLSCVSFVIEIPFFFYGTPSGHDVEFHLYSWLEVLGQWKQGIFYPRWPSLAHFGYGEPRFIFYPPASWTLGSAISAIFPWTLAADIYVWIALVAAGASMFFLASRWLSRRDAIFAAAFYAVNPYHLVIVYWRSAFAELLAGCLLPLLLLLLLKTVEDRRDMTVPLAFLLAAAWLINAPAALMIHYSFALLIVLFVFFPRHPRSSGLPYSNLFLRAAAAVVIGGCLAAFYLIPAIYEQRWIDIANAVSPGANPRDNFLFIHTADSDHNAFNRLISWVAVAEIVGTIAIVLLVAWRRKTLASEARSAKALDVTKNGLNEAHVQNHLWYILAAWAFACTVLMLPGTGLVWDYLPKLRFMQFPWRWLLCLSMIFSFCVAVGIRQLWSRIAIYVTLLLIVILAGWRNQTPWWDTNADLREMQDNMASGVGYQGTDEYTPVGADASAVNKEARNATVDGEGRADIRVLQWNAEEKIFTAQMSVPGRLALHLFRYPAWQVSVNGVAVDAEARADTGQMLVPVAAGPNRVQIRFIRTWDRIIGESVSLITLILLLLWTRREKIVKSRPL